MNDRRLKNAYLLKQKFETLMKLKESINVVDSQTIDENPIISLDVNTKFI